MSAHLVEHGDAMMIDEPNSDSKFTIFNELPPKTRQMIWKASFRGRVVRIALEHIHTGGVPYPVKYNKTPRNKTIFHNSPPYPPTMFVNCESRTTTLLHYTKPCLLTLGVPILFHPELDSVVIDFKNDDAAPSYTCLGGKLVEWDCRAIMQNLLTLFMPCLGLFKWHAKGMGRGLNQEFLEFYELFSFRNLEDLIIVGNGSRAELEQVKAFLEEGFQRKKWKDKKHKVPKITLRHGHIRLMPDFQDEVNTLLNLDL